MKSVYRQWIAKKFLNLRNSKNWTHKIIADKTDIKPTTYRSYEEGRAEPGVYYIEKFCSIVGISVDEFMKDSPFTVQKFCNS